MATNTASNTAGAAIALIRRMALGNAASRSALSLGLGMALFLALPPQKLDQATPAQPTIIADFLAPGELSDRDAAYYESAIASQKAGDYTAADSALTQVRDRNLVGHVLAMRYLDAGYKTSASELIRWLTDYSDHPQATRIARLAGKKGGDRDVLTSITVTSNALKGDGYIEHLGRSGMPAGWYRGLSLWKERKYGPAAKQFVEIGKNGKLSDWQRSAGYYWAFRSLYRIDAKRAAYANLDKARDFTTTFYGLLAAAQQGNNPQLIAAAPYVPHALRQNPHTLRARSLAQIGQLKAAEAELRALYASLDKHDRPAVVTLANELNLANLQVRLSSNDRLKKDESLFASYPMPAWVMDAQKDIDPALVLAVARQESVFREEITSQAGAVGMMQMLPSTARHVMGGMGTDQLALAIADNSDSPMAERLTNPAVNIRLGAAYMEQLRKQPGVRNNLIQVLAAYNAGPGAVASWQRQARMNDPLLYIESIPYAETRNYVMQVMAHYWVYESLMGERSDSMRALAKGEWPQLDAAAS